MKNKLLKIASYIALFAILFIPSIAFAATTQTHWYISTSSYSNARVGTSSNKVGYYFGPGVYYDRFYNTFFHQINDGNNKYLAYCLDPNWYTLNNSAGQIYNSDSTTLVDAQGNEVTGERLKLLKNIMAAGKQQGTYVSAEQFKNSSSALEKKYYLSTQILLWEVMSGGRTDYTPDNLNVPSGSRSSYNFVSTDSQMLEAYKSILSKAKELSDSGKPSVFGGEYILKWNDSKNMYVSDAINIGNYVSNNTNKDITVSSKDSKNNITISTTKEIKNYTDVNFKYAIGASLDDKFQWFKFNATGNNQRMLLAYYQSVNNGKISVKTEKGIFKINKYDLSTKSFIGGAEFTMYKCKSTSSCTKVQTISIPLKDNKAISDEIVINKSGLYKFVESKVPAGYSKLPDFYLNLTITSDGNVDVKVNEKDKDYIKVAKYNATRYTHILAYNEAKSFTISKIDGNDNKTKVKGATFQIKKTDGTVMKFKKLSEGNFEYDANGTITDLVAANLSSYTITLLPVGEYILEETAVPSPYILSSKESDRQTRFKIDKTDFLQTLNASKKYVKSVNATITVKNYKSKVTINKTGSGGKVVEGVTFELYDSRKQNLISVVLYNNEYQYNGNATTSSLVTNSNGKIVINGLPQGTYYLKEVATPEDSGLVIDENNQWTKIVVTLNSNSSNIVKTISNAKGSFCFYKIDENGNYLDKGKFKLQIYNDKISKFEDVALKQNADKTFTIDETNKSGIFTFTPVSGGQTCFVDINTKGRYKIVEIEAPEGFLLPSNPGDAEVELTINEYGYASGDAVIINKRITIGEGANAQAELIIGISTGMDRINYVLIIGGIGLVIGILIYVKKKMDKK